ncbi:uncharacterized protein LOC124722677 [Schistocerca piceifrons]|uniref:uncharacterized protein LOC124722677 n=1 Tax=Schistocerca piceifrons TaxID=274613 RepID=UPI001F5ED126|nr:uncharacterized protein LOC124722677 [Schistocerca piceifrons]
MGGAVTNSEGIVAVKLPVEGSTVEVAVKEAAAVAKEQVVRGVAELPRGRGGGAGCDGARGIGSSTSAGCCPERGPCGRRWLGGDIGGGGAKGMGASSTMADGAVGPAEQPVEPAAAVETTTVAAGRGLAPLHADQGWKGAHPGGRKKAAERLAEKKRRSENPDTGAGVGCGAGRPPRRRCGCQRADGLAAGRSLRGSIRLSGRNLEPR